MGRGLGGASSGPCSRCSPLSLVEFSVAVFGPPWAMNARMPPAERADPDLLGHNLLKPAPEDGAICGRVQLVHTCSICWFGFEVTWSHGIRLVVPPLG